MKFNITEGDWYIGMKPGPLVYGPKGEQIADLSARMVPDKETIANAKAIVAIPQMLKMLETAASLLVARQPGFADEIQEFLSQFEAK